MMSTYREWECFDCGHEVMAMGRPTPIRWSDGHTCRFVEKNPTSIAEINTRQGLDMEKHLGPIKEKK